MTTLWMAAEHDTEGRCIAIHGPFYNRLIADIWIDKRDTMKAFEVQRIAGFSIYWSSTEAEQRDLQRQIDAIDDPYTPKAERKKGRPTKTSELYDADPACKHEVVGASGGGVRCTKCRGWFCY